MVNYFFTALEKYGINIKHFFRKHNLKAIKFRYKLADVLSENDDAITILVRVQGIRQQILPYTPDEIVSDDALLSEFSACDARAITYLSLQKYLGKEQKIFKIDKQLIVEGKTTFILINSILKEKKTITARELYMNHSLMVQLEYMDMINAISTAVQEQTISDFEKINKM